MADKEYHIEKNTLVINNGVTEINIEDFHKYDKDKYGYEILKLKDEIANIKSIIIPDSVTNVNLGAFDGCKSLTIKCNKGSYAEEYAKRYDIPVKHIKDKSKTIERE